ncbi:MAG: DUF3109 family protein [Flavobacteriaceae bacterium]|jgi:hypothetical protein
MLSIQNTLVSEELIDQHFICDLSHCKGECCVAGEAGAPLEADEATYLETHLADIKPFLAKRGKAALAAQGAAVKGVDGSLETPLVEGKECAYTVFSDSGLAQCGIEKAHKEGAISFQKPISCHLYPVRVTSYSEFVAVNYHQWNICDAACQFGAALKIPIYQFVKSALIRKFGKAWYAQLEKEAAKKRRP